MRMIFDLDKLDNPIPLLFSFVTPNYLRRTLKLKKPANIPEDEPLDIIDEPSDEPSDEPTDELVKGLNFDDLVKQDDNDVIESMEVSMMEESIEERKNYKKKRIA